MTTPTTEEKDFSVNLTLRLSIPIWFALTERDRPILPSDAIGLAIERIPEAVFDLLSGEGFEIALPIDGEAEEE